MDAQIKTNTQRRTTQRKHFGGINNVILCIIATITAIAIGYFWYDMIPHYHAKINNVKVSFDKYPSKHDSICVNICSEIIKDVGGERCEIKKIKCKWDHFKDNSEPLNIIVILNYNGHRQKIEYCIMSWNNKSKTAFMLTRFPKPLYIEDRIKVYPEFDIEKTDYGYTTTNSWLYYRENTKKRNKSKTYYFDENGNKIEPPVSK